MLEMDLKNVLLLVAMWITFAGSIPVKQDPKDIHCPQCQEDAVVDEARDSRKKYCGWKDVRSQKGLERVRRYAISGLLWSKKVITWRLYNLTPWLKLAYILKTISRAFRQWEKHSGLTIKRVVNRNADIVISFEPRVHYVFKDVVCNFYFDGPGGAVGHAFYPVRNAVYAGNIHLDVEEIFSTDGSYGFNFESTILHEIGHSLGLMHTYQRNAIMNPDFAMSAKGMNLKLHRDDINGIQVLYGPPQANRHTENDVVENSVEDAEQQKVLKAESVPNSPQASRETENTVAENYFKEAEQQQALTAASVPSTPQTIRETERTVVENSADDAQVQKDLRGSSQANRKAENIVVENSVEDAEQRKVLKTEAVLSAPQTIRETKNSAVENSVEDAEEQEILKDETIPITPQATRENKNSLIENSAADADQHEILKVETVPSSPQASRETESSLVENSVEVAEQQKFLKVVPKTAMVTTQSTQSIQEVNNNIGKDDDASKETHHEDDTILQNEIEVRNETKVIAQATVTAEIVSEISTHGKTSSIPVLEPKPLRGPGYKEPEQCPDSFNAIYMSRNNLNTYFINKMYEYSLGTWLGYKGISRANLEIFPFSSVDAGYRRIKDKKLVLFSGSWYTLVNNESIIDRYSISIEKLGFPSSVKKVDAALIFGPYRNTYFFVGDKYWRYNEKNMAMDAGYPKEISSVWKGVPSNVDAAITWKNGRTYFFKGNKYYRINTRTASVEDGYPKSISVWTKCQPQSKTNHRG